MVEEILRYTVRPGFLIQIVLDTVLDAIYTLRLRNEAEADRTLQLYTDHDGTIRFYILPAKPSVQHQFNQGCSYG